MTPMTHRTDPPAAAVPGPDLGGAATDLGGATLDPLSGPGGGTAMAMAPTSPSLRHGLDLPRSLHLLRAHLRHGLGPHSRVYPALGCLHLSMLERATPATRSPTCTARAPTARTETTLAWRTRCPRSCQWQRLQ
ncbi:hypothetical protein SEVIR_2G146700v4 [Setaria viridis]|uniref:Uncharacterized protein n=1 Tax=Setaria viridis TaxID=4556 RepID=A0A4U6VVU0_SETVI|nr:hypothetical protein SEVIR_2G146700v2 [Setaria viridis]TKW32079.1 hypothetical protein SEVIR_2G146700v2 [Setaria viridis]